MVKRLFLPLWHTVAFIALSVLLAASVLLCCLRGIVLSETVYRELPSEPSFVKAMTGYVLSDLESECLFLDLPYDSVKTAVTAEWIEELSVQYADSLYEAMTTGGEVRDLTVDSTRYREAIDAFFATLPADERPDEAVSAELAEELAAGTARVLQSGLVEKVVPAAHRLLFGNATVKKVASFSGLAIAATVLFVVLSLLWFGSTLRRRVYATAGALFVGSAFVAVPLWLVQRYNLADKLAVGGDTPLKLYIEGIVNGIVDRMTEVALWAFAIGAVLLVAAVVWLVWPPKNKEKRPVKILCIGNSFSTDATRYLSAMADGELYVRNCFIGGCSLKRHYDNIVADAAEYEYQKDGVRMQEEPVALSDALTRDDWDWVTVQQVSSASGKVETYEPYLTEVLAYVREKCPNAKIVFHRTWPYETGSEHPGFANYGNDRTAMFEAIVDASTKMTEAHNLPTIAAGNAVYTAGQQPMFDATQGGQSLYRDGFHLHLIYGRYLVALCWYCFFTGKSVDTVTYVPEGADPELVEELKKFVK